MDSEFKAFDHFSAVFESMDAAGDDSTLAISQTVEPDACALMALPFELLAHCVDPLSARDLIRFGTTTRQAEAWFGDECGQAVLALTAIVLAKDCPGSIMALGFIQATPARLRNGLLRKLSGKMPFAFGSDTKLVSEAWSRCLSSAESWLAAQDGTSWNGDIHQQRCDWIVARWRQSDPYMKQKPAGVESAALRDMVRLPMSYWPAIFAPLLSGRQVSATLKPYVECFFNGFRGVIVKPSTKLIRALIPCAFERVARGGVIAEMQDRFGIGSARLRLSDRYLNRWIALQAASGNGSLPALCDAWLPGDRVFLDRTEDLFLSLIMRRIYAGTSWVMLLDRADAGSERVCRLLQLRFLQREVQDGAQSLAVDEDGDSAATQAYLTKIESIVAIDGHAAWLATWQACEAMQIEWQPSLMYRLSQQLRRCPIPPDQALLFVEQCLSWYAKLGAAEAFSEKPRLTVRATAACMMVLCELRAVDAAFIDVMLEEITNDILADVPLSACGEVLDVMSNMEGLRYGRPFPWLHSREFGTTLRSFIVAPRSSMVCSSLRFATEIVRWAAMLWEQIPDRAVGNVTRIAVFASRFGLPSTATKALYRAILDAISADAVSENVTIQHALEHAGLDRHDIDAMCEVEDRIWGDTVMPFIDRVEQTDWADALSTQHYMSLRLWERAWNHVWGRRPKDETPD